MSYRGNTVDLTDDQIIRMIIREKRRKRKRRKLLRRGALVLMVLVLMVVGITHLKHSPQQEPAQVQATETRGIIFIDAGHGGYDSGAETDDRSEKDDTLELALAVKDQLEKKHFEVVMSREDDIYVERDQRGVMANESGAELMVSIHRNKAEEGQGVEIYISSQDPADDRALAGNIMSRMKKVGITQDRGIRIGTLPDPSDDYLENSVSEMPSCLIEVGFISDQKDNEYFDTKLTDYAKAMAKGIEKTHESLYGGV